MSRRQIADDSSHHEEHNARRQLPGSVGVPLIGEIERHGQEQQHRHRIRSQPEQAEQDAADRVSYGPDDAEIAAEQEHHGGEQDYQPYLMEQGAVLGRLGLGLFPLGGSLFSALGSPFI